MAEEAAGSASARRHAVVVGSSSGIGAAIAARFVADGLDTLALDLPGVAWPDRLAGARKGEIDVTDPKRVDAAFDEAAQSLGAVDIVVNCAGILGRVEPTAEASDEAFHEILSVDLVGAFYVTRAALRLMLPRHQGRIIHIASIAGKEGDPRMAAYSIAKAGVIGLVKTVGKEYASSGVTVNAIAPALIETPLLQGMPAERQAALKSMIPMGRFGTPEEVAALAAFVASPQASFTTGFVYDLSGGRADY